MDSTLRLLLRFILVPLGYLAAVLAGMLVIPVGGWRLGEIAVSGDPDAPIALLLGFGVAGTVLFAMLLAAMWLPAASGILIAEAFAIRTWMFHVANGAAAAFVGWTGSASHIGRWRDGTLASTGRSWPPSGCRRVDFATAR